MSNSFKIIDRPIYIKHVLDVIDKGMTVILIGQRRVGKTFILLKLEEILSKKFQDANILYINKELQAFNEIINSSDLYNYVIQRLPENQRNYLLIDEVQDIKDYQIALRSLQAEHRCQIIATGSNANIFSSELATLLAGRYIEIPVYPLSYKEFLIFNNLEDSDDSLLKFMKIGGLPGLSLFDINDETQVYDYLQGVFSTVMMKDVILREKIRNVTFLENLTTFISNNIGKLFSLKKITQTMNSKGEKISDILTSSYIRYLKDALLIIPLQRFDIRGKKIFEQIQKLYFTDNGLRNLLTGFNIRGSIEKIIENIILTQLFISGYKVYVGILKNSEIDFVAEKNGNRIYIQSTYLLSSDETIKREFGNLAAIKDNYEKIVVSMDPISGEFPEYPGIRHLKLREFLTEFTV